MRRPFSRDPHSVLEPIQDPIHGPINLEDGIYRSNDLIRRLLKTEMLTRLRHVRQLGFASLGFPAADHTRFAHAVGSMHMMRELLERLLDEEKHLAEAAKAVREHFPDFKKLGSWGKNEAFKDRLFNHMLLAALLEDVGELPFAKATELVFLPEPSERAAVEAATRCNTGSWGAKEFFTLALINRAGERDADLRREVNIEFLALLITKNMPGGGTVPPGLLRLCHIVDGVVDADRLDYVFRDAYHTAGSYGTPLSVVQSLLYYDDQGPVFSDPEPVGGFLSIYANLWSTVYFSPQNRFRVIVLATLLQAIRKKQELATQCDLVAILNEGLPVSTFLEFDDRWLFERIRKLKDSRSARAESRVDMTLQVLLEEPMRPDYDALWVTPANKRGRIDQPDSLLGGTLFFDTFFNAREHILYSQKKPIRIRSRLYSADGGDLPLEKCEGPFARLLTDEWTFTKRKNGVLVFFPNDRKGKNRSYVDEVTKLRAFYIGMRNADPLQGAYPCDTRGSDFQPPAIFISYAAADVIYLDRVCQQLHVQHRQYFYLRTDDCTANSPTRDASIKAARAGKAALILLSKTYLERYETGIRARDGNIWEEVKVLVERRKLENLPIRFLSIDDFHDIKGQLNVFPIADLTGQRRSTFTATRIPSLGKALRSATAAEIGQKVGMILEGLDAS